MTAKAAKSDADARTQRKSMKETLEDPDALMDLIGRVGIDATIMMIGAYLGYNGYTPVTALLGTTSAPSGGDPLADILSKLPSFFGPAEAWFRDYAAKTIGEGRAELAYAARVSLEAARMELKAAIESQDTDRIEAARKALAVALSDYKPYQDEIDHKRRMGAAIGALEAYAYTRPEFMTGIGEIIPL